jgi:hypothetical protein
MFRIQVTIWVSLFFGVQAFGVMAQQFVGAPEPGAAPMSPGSPKEQRRRFSLPPGFEIELVTSEEQGVGKPITVAWDDAGRLWTITALEYPLDGNEQPEAARALYEKGGADRVLVIDRPYGAGPYTPRVFAENLAMPMGVLPYQDGAIVGHGPEVLFLRDTDGDGRADQREVILSGFGIQDSHLMPHQFMRVAGGWFYLAQGAFNYSRVRTKDGREHRFDQTRLARFTIDGMRFEDLTSGPCNIWGMVINQEGEGFIQEANDFGYPVMALHHGASYPGCTGLYKPYAPFFPSEIDFRMGGTGLSGLALSDADGSFPEPYADVMFVANPITRKVQAIKIRPSGPWHRYELLPDFVLSSDEWFRPVAIHFGPDGCLYIVDWYNKIISHNEVPRTHPERDKTRGRIWRVRHKDQSRGAPPNVAKAANAELLKHLRSSSTWEMRAAWHQIADRPARELQPELVKIAEDRSAAPAHRIHALWALEELQSVPPETIRKLLAERNRNLRREAVRSLGTLSFSPLPILAGHLDDRDPEVRAEVIRVAAEHDVGFLLDAVKPALEAPAGKNPQTGAPMKLREAYERDFERYLIRAKLEGKTNELNRYIASPRPNLEGTLLAALALNTPESAEVLVGLLGKLERNPNEEELLRLVENLRLPRARQTLAALLARRDARVPALEALAKVRHRIDAASVAPLLETPLLELWRSGVKEFAARIAGSFKVMALAGALEEGLRTEGVPVQIAALRALREMERGSARSLAPLVSATDRALRDEALNSISAAPAGEETIRFWAKFNPVQRRAALRSLTASTAAAENLVAALRDRTVDERDLDADTVEKLRGFFPRNDLIQKMATRLADEFKPVLRLDGKNESFVNSNLKLEGPFTVETWVRLDSGINNNDGILGAPGGADFNFHDGKFRVYCGPELGDRAVAMRAMTPNSWTHLAVTRDSQGAFRTYINGELDATDTRAVTNTFTGLDIGRTGPPGGTAGALMEFRVWDRARSAREIRGEFDRTYTREARAAGLAYYANWTELSGGARIEKTADVPVLLTAEQAREQMAVFDRYRSLAEGKGNHEKGRALFASSCLICHSVGGQGAQIGPC